MSTIDTNDPARWGKLRIAKRIRNQHRKARRAEKTSLGLKPWAREQAQGATPAERRARAEDLDKARSLTPAALAYHWLTR